MSSSSLSLCLSLKSSDQYSWINLWVLWLDLFSVYFRVGGDNTTPPFHLVDLQAAHTSRSINNTQLSNDRLNGTYLLLGSVEQHLLLLVFWHAPLGLHSAIRRHQPPQRAVLSHIDCFVQCKVVGSLDSVQPRDTGTPWWSLPVLWRGNH